MRTRRQVITLLALSVPGVANAEESAPVEHPPTIIERPPVLPLGGWRTKIEVSARGNGDERTGAFGLSSGIFPGFEVSATLVTRLGVQESESGARVRARLVRSIIDGPHLALIASLHGEYDYDARRWEDVGFGTQVQLRLASFLFFAGGDQIGGDLDQSSARLALPVGAGLQLTTNVYLEAIAMLEGSYDSSTGSDSRVAPLAASAAISLTTALDVVIAGSSDIDDETESGRPPITFLLSARYQGTL